MKIVLNLTEREADMLRERAERPARMAHPDLRSAQAKLCEALDRALRR